MVKFALCPIAVTPILILSFVFRQRLPVSQSSLTYNVVCVSCFCVVLFISLPSQSSAFNSQNISCTQKTKSVQQRHSWKVECFSTSQEISTHLMEPNGTIRVHESLPPVPVFGSNGSSPYFPILFLEDRF